LSGERLNEEPVHAELPEKPPPAVLRAPTPQEKAEQHAQHPALAHHFDTLAQQQETQALGMWMFLASELLFFGGLFLCYTVARWAHPDAFSYASSHLVLGLGTLNTAVLLTSSLTMALAVRAAQTGQQPGLRLHLVLTIALGTVFLVIKAIEYYLDYREHLIPGQMFSLAEHDPPTGLSAEHVELYFWIYFTMTGLHALHMVIGIVILGTLLGLARGGRYTTGYVAPVEIAGLYWHFVDIVWIFLFPLLYLIGH
jgi:cytochrome c oxidase subunit III